MEEIKKNTGEQPEIRTSKADEMFTLVKDKKGVRIAVGNYQVSKKVFEKFSDAEAYIWKKPYEILINVTCLFTHLHIQENEKNNEMAKESK